MTNSVQVGCGAVYPQIQVSSSIIFIVSCVRSTCSGEHKQQLITQQYSCSLAGVEQYSYFHNYINGLSDSKGPENITFSIMKHGEMFLAVIWLLSLSAKQTK